MAAGLALWGGCTTTRAIRPLDKGEGAIIASVGGPITLELGPVGIPMPLASVGYAHGLDGKTNLHGAVHLSGLFAFGVPGIDVGVARELLTPYKARPRLMIDGTVVAFFGNAAPGDPPAAIRVLPSVDLVASWPIKLQTLYVGVNQIVQPFPEARYYASPFVGIELRPKKTLGFQLEYQWMAPWLKNEDAAARWVGPGGLGASAIKLGFTGSFRVGRKAPAESGGESP